MMRLPICSDAGYESAFGHIYPDLGTEWGPAFTGKALKMIQEEDNVIYYSSVSIWEISIKHTNHPENVEFTGKELSQFCQEAGFLPVTMQDKHVFALETITRAEGAPPHHDPFDRMLIAQAKAENMIFITHDSLLPYYKEKCILHV